MAFEPAQHSFITLEGVDGAGKSTQARLLARALELAGYQVVSLRGLAGTIDALERDKAMLSRLKSHGRSPFLQGA